MDYQNEEMEMERKSRAFDSGMKQQKIVADKILMKQDFQRRYLKVGLEGWRY